MLPSVKLKSLLSLTAAALALTAGSASAAAPDAPWTGTGTAATTVVSDGTADDTPTLSYKVAGSKGAWEFQATSKSVRQQPVEWRYKGFHAWAGVTVAIEKFVIRGGKEIVRESLANVIRHAEATSCRITLRRTERGAELEIDDDGLGFDPSTAQRGMGMDNLDGRVLALGGDLTVESVLGEGATITVSLPL